MRKGADFDIDDEVLDAVDNPRFICLRGRNAGPFVIAVDEEHGIIVRVGGFFHAFS